MDERQRKLSRALMWDALILLALSAYEFATRVDAMWGPLKMFVRMAIGEHIPVERVAQYVDYHIFTAPLFLLLCLVLALLTLAARRSRRGCAALLLPGAALSLWGFCLRLTLFGDLIRTFKLLPLVCLVLLMLVRAVLPQTRVRRAPAVVRQENIVYRPRRERRRAS